MDKIIAAILMGASIDKLLEAGIKEEDIIKAFSIITKEEYNSICECYLADLYKPRLLFVYKEAMKKKRFDVALKALKEYNAINPNKDVIIDI